MIMTTNRSSCFFCIFYFILFYAWLGSRAESGRTFELQESNMNGDQLYIIFILQMRINLYMISITFYSKLNKKSCANTKLSKLNVQIQNIS